MSLVEKYEKELQYISEGNYNTPYLIKKLDKIVSEGRLNYLKFHGFVKESIKKDVENLYWALRKAKQASYEISGQNTLTNNENHGKIKV